VEARPETNSTGSAAANARTTEPPPDHTTLLYNQEPVWDSGIRSDDSTPARNARQADVGENMDTNTLLIIVVVLLLLGGGGFFYRRRG
jgi:LPXTG-motif cell wall-anchored protein